jgi:hypothetical protein
LIQTPAFRDFPVSHARAKHAPAATSGLGADCWIIISAVGKIAKARVSAA